MKSVRCFFAALAVVCAVALWANYSNVLAEQLDTDSIEDLFDWEHYKSLVAEQATSLQDLADRFVLDQAFYLWITPPSKDFVLHQPGGLVPILDMKAFHDSFIEGLAGYEMDGIPRFPVWLYEDATGNIIVESIEGKQIATIKREWGYSQDWLAREYHPALDTYEKWYRDWLIEMYSPQRVAMRYDIILGEDDLIKYVWVKSIAAAQSPPGGMMKSSWEGGTVSNLQFVSIDKTTNGTIELTIAWPTNGLSTNMVDFFACTNLLVQDWGIAVTTNMDLNTNCFSWVDEDSTNYAVRFYDCWTLDDTDGDGVSDGREKRLYGTDNDDWDTDDDGVGDGAELFTYGTDPINTHNSLLPYSTGFESTNSYTTGTLNGQNGWESDTGVSVQTVAHTGSQGVEIEALEATMTKHFATTNNSVTTELFVYLGPQFSVPTNLPATASSLVSYEAGTGIRGFDGNGSGGGSWSTASGTANLLNQWVELKIVQNYSAQTWSLYVDDVLKLSSLGFKNDSVTQLGAMHVRSGIGGAVLCDDINVQ